MEDGGWRMEDGEEGEVWSLGNMGCGVGAASGVKRPRENRSDCPGCPFLWGGGVLASGLCLWEDATVLPEAGHAAFVCFIDGGGVVRVRCAACDNGHYAR
jgi:hypothetical protein